MEYSIDINCDSGESSGTTIRGNDAEVFPFISSCNIACGFHGGDPVVMERTVDLAIQNGLRIGAHPSFPDAEGFGRREMDLPFENLKSIIKYQVAALSGIVRSKGGKLSYVKPHGALYNMAAKNEKEAQAVIEALIELNDELKLMGLAGSPLEKWALESDLGFIAEGFADRRYTDSGELVSRSIKGAVITDPNVAAMQVIKMVKEKGVTSLDGKVITIDVESICIHGDNPSAVDIARAINQMLKVHSIHKTSGLEL